MGLVRDCHPGTDTLVQQDVLRVERLEFGIFRCLDLLADEVISPQVEGKPNHAYSTRLHTGHGDEQQEEMQPSLVREGHPEDLRPEPIGRDHAVGLLRLVDTEGPEGAVQPAVTVNRVDYRCPVNGTKQCATQNACHAHHVERVQGPVVEALDEQEEAEDGCHTEGGRKEPARLAQGIHQEDRHVDHNGPEKAMAL